MLGQSKISSFFTTETTKRRSEDLPVSPPSKSMKIDQSGAGSRLSPEQKSAIEEKRKAALSRLASKTGPNGMGQSWKKALEPEFSKDYFKKV